MLCVMYQPLSAGGSPVGCLLAVFFVIVSEHCAHPGKPSDTLLPGILHIVTERQQLWNCIMDEASRRLAVLERQCCAGPGPSSSSLSQQQQSSSYASVTGTPSSYARVHGTVSREPARWREIQYVAKEGLEEVKYAKSDEGIAKVVNADMKLLQMAVVLLSPLGFESISPLVSQITINRPEKRNAFTPRTGNRPSKQADVVSSSKQHVCQDCWVGALRHCFDLDVVHMQSWRCHCASRMQEMTLEWESSS